MKNSGYIALTSILVISVIIVLITITQALTSINEGQFSLSYTQKEESLNFTESCVEDALIKLNKNNTLPSTIYLPSGTCTLTSVSNVGTGWTFTVTGNVANFIKSIKVEALRGSSVTVTSWQEN